MAFPQMPPLYLGFLSESRDINDPQYPSCREALRIFRIYQMPLERQLISAQVQIQALH